LPPNLKISQIVALRFAADDEFLPLIERTLDKNLTQKEVKNWKPDNYRV
jgi:hypothetical protein